MSPSTSQCPRLLIGRPHLYVQSDEERAAEERRSFTASATGSNSTPLIHVEEQRRGTSAKRMSSPERFEIKQLIASGAVSAADVSHLWHSRKLTNSIPIWTTTLRRILATRKSSRISISRSTSLNLHSWRVRPRSRWNFHLSRSSRHRTGRLPYFRVHCNCTDVQVVEQSRLGRCIAC